MVERAGDSVTAQLDGLPAPVAASLADFIAAAREACGSDLVSAALFGSAAEGRLAPTSDVNLLLVLRAFGAEQAAALRPAYAAAQAAIRLHAMFLLESELAAATELFAQKFADIRRRHRRLYGADLVAGLRIPRAAEIFRLRQVLLNLALRLRDAQVAQGGRPEQVARILADALGPLRAAAATLLELEGADIGDALAAVAAGGEGGGEAVAQLLAVHAGQSLAGAPDDAVDATIALITRIAERVARLDEGGS
jgi:predicted nucleotidyltransferase